MNLIVYIYLLFILASKAASKRVDAPCAFKDTVDLTKHTPSENGSYIYQNILIPTDNVSSYHYRLEFHNKSKTAKGHLRGCICDAAQGRPCIKLCCQEGQFYNETLSVCQPLPDAQNMPTNLNILLESGEIQTVDIFERFIHQFGLPCKRPEVLIETVDIFSILEVRYELCYHMNCYYLY